MYVCHVQLTTALSGLLLTTALSGLLQIRLGWGQSGILFELRTLYSTFIINKSHVLLYYVYLYLTCLFNQLKDIFIDICIRLTDDLDRLIW